jgi:hypothetical protein
MALLFPDIDVPRSMDGINLAHAVCDRWPPIKILVVSGQARVKPPDLPANSRLSVNLTGLRYWSGSYARCLAGVREFVRHWTIMSNLAQT